MNLIVEEVNVLDLGRKTSVILKHNNKTGPETSAESTQERMILSAISKSQLSRNVDAPASEINWWFPFRTSYLPSEHAASIATNASTALQDTESV